MNTEKEVFISKDHQIAMALDDDIISVENKLTKGDAPPLFADTNICPKSKAPDKNHDKHSDLTGLTRESKANRYAVKAVKEVAYQYTETIALKDADLEAKEDKIAQLEAALKHMQTLQGQVISDSTLSDQSDKSMDPSANYLIYPKSTTDPITDKELEKEALFQSTLNHHIPQLQKDNGKKSLK